MSLKGNFSDKEIVEMSIYKVDENKKTLQVISDRARPFIKNFDFIKGFEDGRLDKTIEPNEPVDVLLALIFALEVILAN